MVIYQCSYRHTTSDEDFQQQQKFYSTASYLALNMSNFVSGSYDLRTVLIFCYTLKKIAAESHRMFVEACGEHALGKSQFSREKKTTEKIARNLRII